MVNLSQELVEEKIIEVIQEIIETLDMEVSLDSGTCPGLVPGITSHVQVSIMSRLQRKLEVIIPDNCYLFYDDKQKRQLSIKSSAEKLIKNAKYAKRKSELQEEGNS